jgi:hypothetical protein
MLFLPSTGCGEDPSKPNGTPNGSGASAGEGGTSGAATGGASGQATNGGSPEDADSAGAPGQGGPAADVAGEYTVSLTNQQSSCMLDWRQGAKTNGVMFTIRQDGTNLTAEAGGDAAVSLVLITGTNAFVGNVEGDTFTLVADGPTVFTTGACSYTVQATVEGTLQGDIITGTLTYRPVLSTDPQCAQYACAAVAAFTGVRATAG